MDLGAAVDRLYGLPRDRFVAERDKLARAQPALADRIRKLRKPTVAAGQANQLARKHKKDVAALVEVGRELRTAQERLDGPALRTLSRQRVDVLDRLVGRLPDAAPGLRELLERSSTDPEAAEDLLAGRLVTTPEGGGWGFDMAAPADTGRVAKRDKQRGSDKQRREDEKRRQADEQRRQEEERRRREYDEAKAAQAEAQQALDAAEDELQARTDRVEELRSELAEARAARDEAADVAKRARQQVQRRTAQVSAAERRL